MSADAGYVFPISGNGSAIADALALGAFGVTTGDIEQSRPIMGTLWDFLSMRPNEWVFFFNSREFRGLARTRLLPGRRTVALTNWPGSGLVAKRRASESLAYPGASAESIPWFFGIEPYVGSQSGVVDMDELLQSDASGVLRAIPLFSDVNMLKLEPLEAEAVANALLRRLGPPSPVRAARGSWRSGRRSKDIDTTALVRAWIKIPTRGVNKGVARFESEYTVQAWLVDQLARHDPTVGTVFGSWDYVVNQEPASPLKPRKYMDKIDLFGWSSKQLSPDLHPVVTEYKVVEVKGEGLTGDYGVACVDQVMKYVDWVANSRAGGDYELVDAYLVAQSFDSGVLRYARRRGRRRYIVPRRPYRAAIWSRVTLVEAQPSSTGIALRVV